ncbi:MAG: PaaI family thioesterase [Archaeoglobaceae archaeon]|nr:PaaI family thioesterase [Archaeoglobaceae archaeon]MDW7989170.1 PaaI family thioesterase [Archaeoglobaceae archaeon]
MDLYADPFRKFLKCEIEEIRDGFARVKAVVKDSFLNFYGVVHGAFIMALLDFAFAISANTDARRVAINISVYFYSPAKLGDVIYAESERIKGKKTGFYKLRAFKEDELIAEGSAIAKMLEKD